MTSNLTREMLHKLGITYSVENALIVEQAVNETILAILATDTRDVVYTTYDRGFVAGVLSRVVDSVRKHWNLDATN